MVDTGSLYRLALVEKAVLVRECARDAHISRYRVFRSVGRRRGVSRGIAGRYPWRK